MVDEAKQVVNNTKQEVELLSVTPVICISEREHFGAEQTEIWTHWAISTCTTMPNTVEGSNRKSVLPNGNKNKIDALAKYGIESQT